VIRPSLLREMLIVYALLFTVLVAREGMSRRVLPSGMNPELFPEPDFDENSPVCASSEPCGFYSFSLHPAGKASPFKWIRSWCRCGEEDECVYDRVDTKMRLYRQTCTPKERSTNVVRHALQPYKTFRSHKPRRHVVEALYRYRL